MAPRLLLPSPTSRWRLTLLAAFILVVGPLIAPSPLSAQPVPVVVYLVRHAERQEDGTADPHISEAGRERARALAAMLRDAGITHIHTTDLKRTRETGATLADALGLGMAVYDPRDLPGLAARLRDTPGRHLVLGHSNTTGEMAAALRGESHGPIADMEYDRLYVLVIPREGPVSTTLLRFGAPWAP